MVTEAAMVMDFIDTSDEPQGRGSRPEKSPNHHRQRLSRALCTQDSYWHQKTDAIGLLELLPQQKMTDALRMLAYGAATDQCDEIYLRRLLARGEQRGFPGMIGSIDCMHWEWKNCPNGWGGAYSGRKGRPTIILEVVASYDTWVFHTFFGVPGAQNDINVIGQSPVFDKVIARNSPTVVFHVNGKRYNNAYYLADGIYPRYSTFVKTISNPATQSQKLFAKKQEAYRKM
ncbi:uncharacterized protein LOC141696533 [Apium graveolens]|uniref:uncharacterized protein LOC141696533 n=1 Tax=Apium graveolens TaxID=4045 RepID=UPI003D7910C7